jgi:hypothetical protein
MDITSVVVIRKIENSFTEIEALYQGAPPSALVAPALANGWSVKDTLGHLAAWTWRFVFVLNAARDSDGPLYARPDVEGLNQTFYQERRSWPWLTTEADFRHAYGALLGVIRDFPPERLAAPLVQKAIARETWEHHAEHLPDLERWRKRWDAEAESIPRLSIASLYSGQGGMR